MNIPIIYEDKDVLAVNKPAGLVVHPDGKREEPALTDWILKNYLELENVGEPLVIRDTKYKILDTIQRPGIVHRLDRDTSGILLIAKNQDVYTFLKNQFQNHTIKKTYKALVYDPVSPKEGIIDKPIKRSAKDFRLRTTDTRGRGESRSAVTGYKVIISNEAYSFLEAYPQTGRTHQIRVHMKAIGHPVACDSLYAPKRFCPPQLNRLGLHAYALEFKTPKGAMLRLEAPMPDDFLRTVTSIFGVVAGFIKT